MNGYEKSIQFGLACFAQQLDRDDRSISSRNPLHALMTRRNNLDLELQFVFLDSRDHGNSPFLDAKRELLLERLKAVLAAIRAAGGDPNAFRTVIQTEPGKHVAKRRLLNAIRNGLSAIQRAPGDPNAYRVLFQKPPCRTVAVLNRAVVLKRAGITLDPDVNPAASSLDTAQFRWASAFPTPVPANTTPTMTRTADGSFRLSNDVPLRVPR